MVQTVLADDHRVFLEGLTGMIEAAGISVVGVTSDRDQLLELILQKQPDVAVVDVAMPGISIPEMLLTIRQRGVPTHLLVLTADDDPRLAEDMLRAGARGHVLKEHAFADVLIAIRSVAAGQTYVSPQLAGTMLTGRSEAASDAPMTDRQLEILRLVAAGDTSKRIARKLSIHVKTVDAHRNRIREKLQVRSSAEMVRVASQRRLI